MTNQERPSMRRFQDLLPGLSSPAEEQKHAANRIADAVRSSGLGWWRDKSPSVRKFFLVVVASYSRRDLEILDLLEGRKHDMPIYVVDVMGYSDSEDFRRDIGVEISNTPSLVFGSDADLRVITGARAVRDALGIGSSGSP